MKTVLVAEAQDALERINTNAFDHDLLFQYRGGVLGRELTLIVRDLADAFESVRAEHDAALARLAEIEAVAEAGSSKPLRPSARAWGAIVRRADVAEARIAEAAKLHRPRKHWNSDREYVFVCDECTRINRYGIAQWPCPTAVSLGLNEGENDESLPIEGGGK